MITGAARAEAALLVIDAKEGVRENSRRHGYMLSMLGIRQVAVLVNKMDLVDCAKTTSRRSARSTARSSTDRRAPHEFIPVGAREGENIATRSAGRPGTTGRRCWSAGRLKRRAPRQALRMPLQAVYKFTETATIAASSGPVEAGDRVRRQGRLLAVDRISTIKSIEALSGPRPDEAYSGQATGLTLDTQVYAKPGELMVRADQDPPMMATRIRANIFWMNTAPISAATRAPRRCSRRPRTWPTSSSSCAPASSATSRSAAAAPRTRTTAAASSRCAAGGT